MKFKVLAFDLFNTVFDPASIAREDADFYVAQLRRWRQTGEYRDVIVGRAFNTMRAFSDAVPAFDKLRDAGYLIVAASNLPAPVVRCMSRNAGVYWNNVIDFRPIKLLKPAEGCYREICRNTGADPGEVLMITNNAGSGDDTEPARIGMRSKLLDRGNGYTLANLADDLLHYRLSPA